MDHSFGRAPIQSTLSATPIKTEGSQSDYPSTDITADNSVLNLLRELYDQICLVSSNVEDLKEELQPILIPDRDCKSASAIVGQGTLDQSPIASYISKLTDQVRDIRYEVINIKNNVDLGN